MTVKCPTCGAELAGSSCDRCFQESLIQLRRNIMDLQPPEVQRAFAKSRVELAKACFFPTGCVISPMLIVTAGSAYWMDYGWTSLILIAMSLFGVTWLWSAACLFREMRPSMYGLEVDPKLCLARGLVDTLISAVVLQAIGLAVLFLFRGG